MEIKLMMKSCRGKLTIDKIARGMKNKTIILFLCQNSGFVCLK